MKHIFKEGKGFCHPFKMANRITRTSGPYSLITVAMAENRLPYHRCLISVCPMVIRSRFGTLKGLFLLPGGVYTDNSYSLGVIRSFKINNAIRNGLSNRMCGMARFYCSCVLVNRLNRPVLSKIGDSCKGIGIRNNAGKREFGTLVLEKLHKTLGTKVSE